MSTLSVINLQSQSTTAPVSFQTSTGTEIGRLCRAFVNFDGTTASPSTIRGSFNVSSVTKNGGGDYTVNFTTSLADANYAVTTSYNFAEAISSYNSSLQVQSTTYTSSAVRVRAWYGTAGASSDTSICNVAVFR